MKKIKAKKVKSKKLKNDLIELSCPVRIQLRPANHSGIQQAGTLMFDQWSKEWTQKAGSNPLDSDHKPLRSNGNLMPDRDVHSLYCCCPFSACSRTILLLSSVHFVMSRAPLIPPLL
ncbi:hypothetical protein PoB_003652300 [Plakobranchus ocellatus]|uniref:Uncharacterized protein n=1 Tax=Plakobranchus ocellatus TaxID=259542 RepID=A0AAV4ATY9_9GAST|nr:hypothetical protein PoB_003652300 [Plakobranchus ocellatus]